MSKAARPMVPKSVHEERAAYVKELLAVWDQMPEFDFGELIYLASIRVAKQSSSGKLPLREASNATILGALDGFAREWRIVKSYLLEGEENG